MQISGRIKMIGHPQHISQSFRKRELVLTTEEQYPQDILIEFQQDKINLLDSFQPGQPVRVHINLRGREWISPQGEVKYFNSIQGWKVESLNAPNNALQQNYQQPQQPNYSQPTQNQYAQQPSMNQPMQNQYNQTAPQQGYTQQQQNMQFPPTPAFNDENHDDLPF